jgi:hypothetical protein
MFIITMRGTFAIGDRDPVHVKGEPATLWWRDEHTLVINDTDIRRIVRLGRGTDGGGRPCLTFTCTDADGSGGTVITGSREA